MVEELSDQMSTKLVDSDICWVITVPAIWKAGAKQFMRKAAYDVSTKVCTPICMSLFLLITHHLCKHTVTTRHKKQARWNSITL